MTNQKEDDEQVVVLSRGDKTYEVLCDLVSDHLDEQPQRAAVDLVWELIEDLMSDFADETFMTKQEAFSKGTEVGWWMTKSGHFNPEGGRMSA